MVHGPSSPPHDSYDVLLVLTTELHQDDHIRLIMDQGEKNKPLYLVKMDKEMEIIRGRLDGPCKTCAWERMQARALEFQKKRKLELESTDNAKHQQTSKVPSGIKLWEPEEIAEVLLKDIPELRKKAFSKFLVDFTSEQRKLKSTSTGFFAGSAFLKNNKMSQEDVDKTSLVFQSQDLTDQPSKLLSIFNALEYFRLDVGLLGETGCGSSSLFNSLLSLKNGDSRASPVGVFETTKTPVTYLYSECHNVLLWDLPGLRRVEDFKTVSSDVASHQDLQIPPCDVYILVSPLRLNLGCIHLLKQLLAQGKDCYLVLSKADLIEEKSIDDVRRWTEEILDKLGLKQIVYLVSALHPETLDLPKMIKTLKDAQDSHKRAALANYVVKLLEEDMFWKRADPCKIN
ncbi:Interferon-inducible GTPase 5 [Bagarius yarrelli]|uniref:Interferon-inducible GTPase 5 n=1 Tax=Bagarius yarrelli TaxID=175774 RepID=A0A556TM36_BAGYA|nr:Interferon-inducible GTPase 5 [Bagarius yarrelli]